MTKEINQHSPLMLKNSIEKDTSSIPYIDTSREFQENSNNNNNNNGKTSLNSCNENNKICELTNYSENLNFLPETFYGENIPENNIFIENSKDICEEVSETQAQFVTQSCITYLITGLAFVLSGLLFERNKDGLFLSKYSFGIMLSPALLGLKGNIETTFASRLTTAFHCGKLERGKAKRSYFFGNMALVQIQSVVVSIFIVICASSLRLFLTNETKFNINFVEQIFVLMAAAITSTCLCSLLLGFVLFTIMKYSKRWELNPDNFLTPLSASLGDFITMIIFLFSGYLLVVIGNNVNSFIRLFLPIFIVSTFILFSIFCGYIACTEPSSKIVLKNGWLPIVIASTVSNIAGLILTDNNLDKKGMLLLQPLICGLLGNRVTVQCSRLSSSLHKSKVEYGYFPNNISFNSFLNPLNTYFSKDFNSKIAISQIITSVPAQYMFVSISFIISETYYVKKNFYLYYGLLSLFLMIILMYVCNVFVHFIWKIKYDPDTVSIPILTSLTDVLATFGLSILLSHIGKGIQYFNSNNNIYCENTNNTFT